MFKLVIYKISDLLKKESLNYSDASNMKIEIENALKNFEDSIIKPTDKSKLKSTIDEAINLYDSSSEGNSVGEYKTGSKKVLLDSINESKKVYNDKLSQQKNIDIQVTKLKNAISKFKSSINKDFTLEVALDYVAQKSNLNLVKRYNGMGEPLYVESDFDENGGYEFSAWSKNARIINGKKAYCIFISYDAIIRGEDITSVLVYEDGQIEEKGKDYAYQW